MAATWKSVLGHREVRSWPGGVRRCQCASDLVPSLPVPTRNGQNTTEIGHSTRLRVVVVFREIGRLLAHAESARLLLESQGALAWCALIFLPVIAIVGFFSGSAVVTQWWRYVALLVVAFSRHGGDFLGPARVLAECAQSAATQPDADES